MLGRGAAFGAAFGSCATDVCIVIAGFIPGAGADDTIATEGPPDSQYVYPVVMAPSRLTSLEDSVESSVESSVWGFGFKVGG